MADVVPQPTPPIPAPTPEAEIHVIPEKYYGAALRAKVPGEDGKPPQGADPNAIVKPSRNAAVPYIALAVGVIVLGAGGAFVYFNKDTLFPPPPPPTTTVEPPVQAPPPAAAPSAPTDLSATSTNPQSASLSWIDTASDESGFRLERADGEAAYHSLTNLPPNSTSYLDVSVQPGISYKYRVYAVNEGGDSAASNEGLAVVPTPQAPAPPPPEQPKLPPGGLDADGDGLTDAEELSMSSDARNPDTDSDGFLDGNEVFNLYNPNGRAPGRLLDAGLVSQVSGNIGWTMQIPKGWTYVPDATGDGSKATIKTTGAEFFTISVEGNPNKLSVIDWFMSQHPDAKVEDLRKFMSKKGYEGIIGPDLLTTYLPWGDYIFSFKYELANQTFINFRTLYSMMLNSLTLSGLPQAAPATNGVPLPFEPAATQTGVVAQPTAVEPGPASSSQEAPLPSPSSTP